MGARRRARGGGGAPGGPPPPPPRPIGGGGGTFPVAAPAGVETAHREVRAVLDTLARFKRWGQVVPVPEIGLTGLLAGVSDDRLVEFVKRHLGALAEHDRTRGGSLVPTLKAFLEAGGEPGGAPRPRIPPNTPRHRPRRVRGGGGGGGGGGRPGARRA